MLYHDVIVLICYNTWAIPDTILWLLSRLPFRGSSALWVSFVIHTIPVLTIPLEKQYKILDTILFPYSIVTFVTVIFLATTKDYRAGIFSVGYWLYLSLAVNKKNILLSKEKRKQLRLEVEKCLKVYFSFTCIRDEKLKIYEERHGALGTESNYIVAYQPHGILPSMPAFGFTDFPKLNPVVHIHDAIFRNPAMEYLCNLFNTDIVRKTSIVRNLIDGKSVAIVPGGVQEMMLCTGDTAEIKIYTGHKGFIRLAIDQNKPLLPVFGFGENQVMRLVQLPRIQQWTKKIFGIPLPFLPVGRWNTPLPERTPLAMCVGEPIFPGNMTVDELHKAYYLAVRDMFEANKLGKIYRNNTLKFIPDIS